MDFTSDNAAGVHPHILQAVLQAAGPEPIGYDGDRFSTRLNGAFSQIFETDVSVFAVPSGTAANALGLAALVPPYGGVWCHKEAHIEVDEAGAIPFYSGGASLMLIEGENGKLTPEALNAAAQYRRGDIHQIQPAALSLTQATECGTVYSPSEVAVLCDWAKARGLGVHMDGARLANALATLKCAPADITWRAGVDVLSFGCIKNGGMLAEALVVFDPDAVKSVPFRRKRAGLMPSKGRFAASQLLAAVDRNLWLDIAAQANGMAQILAQACPSRLVYPVEANALFLRLSAAEQAHLRALGYGFYEWELAGADVVRLVVRWDQDPAVVQALAAELRAFA